MNRPTYTPSAGRFGARAPSTFTAGARFSSRNLSDVESLRVRPLSSSLANPMTTADYENMEANVGRYLKYGAAAAAAFGAYQLWKGSANLSLEGTDARLRTSALLLTVLGGATFAALD